MTMGFYSRDERLGKWECRAKEQRAGPGWGGGENYSEETSGVRGILAKQT